MENSEKQHQFTEPQCAKSGSPMRKIPIEELQSTNRQKMSPVVGVQTMVAILKVLIRETGLFRGVWIFMKSTLWDTVFHKPEWHPEYFTFKSAEEEAYFKEVFNQLSFMIIVFNELKRRYGPFLADEITAKMAIPAAIPYLRSTFTYLKDLADIEQILDQLADYLAGAVGPHRGFEGDVYIAEDHTEARLHITKCAYIMIMKAYGLKTFAANSCLADHVLFDNFITNVKLGRQHAIGVDDAYCDHILRLRSADDTEKDEGDYADSYKARFGGRDMVEHWKEVYRLKRKENWVKS